jgi:hypothetical protein
VEEDWPTDQPGGRSEVPTSSRAADIEMVAGWYLVTWGGVVPVRPGLILCAPWAAMFKAFCRMLPALVGAHAHAHAAHTHVNCCSSQQARQGKAHTFQG